MALLSRTLTAPLFAAAFLAPLLLAPSASASVVPQGVPVVSGAPWGVWRTETVDEGDVFGPETGLALDSQDRPHIVYMTSGSDPSPGLHYATRDGLTWTAHRLEASARPGDIAVDSQDNPHIAYQGNGLNGHLRYAHSDGQTWRMETVDDNPQGSVGPDGIDIVLDRQGLPHIAYHQNGQGSRYAHQDAAGLWHLESVEADPGLLGGWNRIALDSQGRAHVIYGKLQQGQGITLKYAVRTAAGVWTVQTVHPSCGAFLSLALDSKDRPHITCHANLQGLLYLRHTGQAWVQELVDAGATRGYDTSLQLDRQDRPHVTYYNLYSFSWRDDPLAPGQLHYGFQDPSGKWTLETVDRVGQNNGEGSSLRLDSQGRPHVSYTLGWWRWEGDESALNRHFDLMYAEPAAATVLGAAGL